MCCLCSVPSLKEIWQLLHAHDWQIRGGAHWEALLVVVVEVVAVVCNAVAVITSSVSPMEHRDVLEIYLYISSYTAMPSMLAFLIR